VVQGARPWLPEVIQRLHRCLLANHSVRTHVRAAMWAIMLAVSLALLGGCGESYRYLKSGEVGWKLKKEIRDRNAKEVDLARLASFEWDELFLFGPYQPTADVCARLALGHAECKSAITKESADDGEMLMVFRRKGEIMHVEVHYLFHGDFTPLADEQPITPRDAVFVITADGVLTDGQPRLRLKKRGG
jgi:hypothetical protein